MTLIASCRTLVFLLVASFAPDVEGVVLGAGRTRIGDVLVFAVAIEAAFRFSTGFGGVVANLALEFPCVEFMGEGDRCFLGLSLVDDDDIGSSSMCNGQDTEHSDGKRQQRENDNNFPVHE